MHCATHFPFSMISVKILHSAASVFHGMMLNNFTGAVYHVADSANVATVAEALKASIASDNVDTIKAAIEKYQQAFYPIAEKMYKAGGMGADAGAGAQNEDGSFNADFTEK